MSEQFMCPANWLKLLKRVSLIEDELLIQDDFKVDAKRSIKELERAVAKHGTRQEDNRKWRAEMFSRLHTELAERVRRLEDLNEAIDYHREEGLDV